MSFHRGFAKQAGLAENEHVNALQDSAIGLLPLGHAGPSILGKRPEGHSRGTELVARIGGTLIGSKVPLAILKPKTVPGMIGTAVAGGLGGGYLGSLVANSRHYKNGKLTDRAKKSLAKQR